MKKSSGAVDRIEQQAIGFVWRPQAETDHGEQGRRADLESRVGGDPVAELASHFDLIANDLRQPFVAVVTQDEPELQGAETAAERDTVVHEC